MLTEQAVRTGHEHILVVEDDAPVRKIISRILERLGYRVTEAEGAAEGLHWIEAGAEVDAVLIDIGLPGLMNGHALWERVLACRPEMRVLFVSGYASDSLIEAGKIARDEPFLQKPFRREDVAAAVRAVLA